MRLMNIATVVTGALAVASMATLSSTASAAQASVCTPGRLQAAIGTTQGGAGSIATTVVLTNASGRTCVLAGYPGMAFIGGNGAVLARRVTRGGTALFRDPGARIVTLEPTGVASFSLGSVMPQRTPCPRTVEVAVTPPGARTSLYIGTPGARGIDVCAGRKLVVSAVVAGMRGALR